MPLSRDQLKRPPLIRRWCLLSALCGIVLALGLVAYLFAVPDDIRDDTYCKVHGVKMSLTEVSEYAYTTALLFGASNNVREALFPNSWEVPPGGQLYVRGPQTQRVYVCSRCQEAYAQWRRVHPRPPLISV